MDVITLGGLVVAFGGIIGGMLIEGGHLNSIMQLTAAFIVLGGTIGAVLVGTTKADLIMGLKLLRLAFKEEDKTGPEQVLKELIATAQLARKESLLAIERKLTSFSHPFMQNVFRFVIDGLDAHALREIFEAKISIEEENELAGAKIFVDAGGYAPTVGIIGAVLGLIHIMGNLTDTSKLGSGIAVAFVATVYGVGLANLVCLPIGAKIKRRIRKQNEMKIMILEGAIGIMGGLNPYVIEEKLKAFVHDAPPTAKPTEAA